MAQLEIDDIRYCIRCGTALEQRRRAGKVRPVCPACDWTFYPDPKVAVTTLIERGDEVLLVRRINEPFQGLWTLPGGFVDAGEDPSEAAQRECLEETGLTVRITRLLDVIPGLEHARGAHILIGYAAEVVGGELAASDDADKAAWFKRDALPELAFSSTKHLLDRV